MDQSERETGQTGEGEERVYRVEDGEISPYTPTEKEERPRALLFADNLWPAEDSGQDEIGKESLEEETPESKVPSVEVFSSFHIPDNFSRYFDDVEFESQSKSVSPVDEAGPQQNDNNT